MDQEKIEQLEEEIRNLYLNHADENWRAFWFVHVKPVIDQSKELAIKYKGDLEVIWLSAILHDFGQLEALESHEEIGSKKAYKSLIDKGYTEEIAERVKNTILTHRANKHYPETLEQKILATADAMCHFKTPHYIWLARINSQSLPELFKKVAGKIEGDFNEKIFFEEEKESIKKEYEFLKKWFKFEI